MRGWQGCARGLLSTVGLNPADYPRLQWKTGGINHQSWLLEVRHDGEDLYPMIKERAADILQRERKKGKANPKLKDKLAAWAGRLEVAEKKLTAFKLKPLKKKK